MRRAFAVSLAPWQAAGLALGLWVANHGRWVTLPRLGGLADRFSGRARLLLIAWGIQILCNELRPGDRSRPVAG